LLDGSSRELRVSNIPSTSISQALTPVNRHTHDALRAKKLQSQKQSHHKEDVEELDDTAVNSVSEDSQKKGGGQGKQPQSEEEAAGEEKLELQSLPVNMLGAPLKEKADTDAPRLDISA
jgi:hypothetical protein